MLVEAKNLLIVTGDPRLPIGANGFDVKRHRVDWGTSFKDELGRLSDHIGSFNGDKVLAIGDAGALAVAGILEHPDKNIRAVTLGSRLSSGTHRDFPAVTTPVHDAVDWLRQHDSDLTPEMRGRIGVANLRKGEDHVPSHARSLEGAVLLEIPHDAEGHEEGIRKVLTTAEYMEPITVFLEEK